MNTPSHMSFWGRASALLTACFCGDLGSAIARGKLGLHLMPAPAVLYSSSSAVSWILRTCHSRTASRCSANAGARSGLFLPRLFPGNWYRACSAVPRPYLHQVMTRSLHPQARWTGGPPCVFPVPTRHLRRCAGCSLQEDKRIAVDAGGALRGEKVKEDLFVINPTMCYALSCSGTAALRRVIAEAGAIAA